MRRISDSLCSRLEHGIESTLIDSSLVGVTGPHDVAVVEDETELPLLIVSEQILGPGMKISVPAAIILLFSP
jgi:hypothetical protein